MKRLLSGGLLALTLLGLTACSTETVVTLQDGTQYITEDRPNTKTADGFYEFTDVAGRHVRVKAADVATIKAED
ncbi:MULTISPECIES: YgdI/YgdR family lipoprotein [Pseudomonadaceae]|jgi:major membrane immunogen (membrane-anchored lipoprotein)|uniref:Lipoprotein YgdI/YgdR-like SH3-like domain-containing protein n=2 Tax=Pseudomonadaceae TaxID=135621 RepID=A0A1G5PEC0_9PSED|nr:MULTISPECIES: YgdI/YgdR family lipoprotein [Pseudomonas]HCV75186.1 YgdI/YgdR family lipoprotein [Pseudomonas sp.]KIZ48637.1 lipoprotein [Pseudomonas oryzihabitans]KTT57782.1 lipoprotein [Pseudomonas psychrotolerans]MBA1261224.1 YgdI/YgdR family lipoprotein [Pseudomonas psychrotolerans]MBH3328870.1 YgdI/YgdR family lipoprotein [Pseudomonas oryzihabitans]